MNLYTIFVKFFCIRIVTLFANHLDPNLNTDEDSEPFKHDAQFTKQYYVIIVEQNKNTKCFISTTINVFHFDFFMNAYKSMTNDTKNYFTRQLSDEASNLTNPAKIATDKLIVNRLTFVSYQALIKATDNFLEVINATDTQYKKFDIKNKNSYVKQANGFLDQYTQSPQKMVKDNCTIGVIGVVGVQAQWKYPFKNEGRFMKAEGKFNFAHDLQLKIDILQIPFKGGEMQITLVISRNRKTYSDAEERFHLAYLGKFNVQIDTIYLPRIAYSVLIKDYSHDNPEEIDSDKESNKPAKEQCMTQKLVMNIDEKGINTFIKKKLIVPGWDMNDWKYGNYYYPLNNSCMVDSPFFFTINYRPTNETILMGKWSPSCGPYIEETVKNDDY